jgi:hypothetical protein
LFNSRFKQEGSTSMSEPEQQPTKEDLIAQLHTSRHDLWALVETLSDADSVRLHDDQGWSVVDHLVHVAVWQNGIAALLRHQSRWDAMGLSAEEVQRAADGDALNAVLQSKFASMSAPDARQFLRTTEQALDAALAPLSTEDINKSYAFYAAEASDNATAVGAYIMGNSVEHYAEHLPWIEAIVRAP